MQELIQAIQLPLQVHLTFSASIDWGPDKEQLELLSLPLIMRFKSPSPSSYEASNLEVTSQLKLHMLVGSRYEMLGQEPQLHPVVY